MATLTSSNQNSILKIREFLGLNENPDGDTHIKNGELSECLNFRITQDRHLQLRPGQKTLVRLQQCRLHRQRAAHRAGWLLGLRCACRDHGLVCQRQ